MTASRASQSTARGRPKGSSRPSSRQANTGHTWGKPSVVFCVMRALPKSRRLETVEVQNRMALIQRRLYIDSGSKNKKREADSRIPTDGSSINFLLALFRVQVWKLEAPSLTLPAALLPTLTHFIPHSDDAPLNVIGSAISRHCRSCSIAEPRPPKSSIDGETIQNPIPCAHPKSLPNHSCRNLHCRSNITPTGTSYPSGIAHLCYYLLDIPERPSTVLYINKPHPITSRTDRP